MLEFHSPKLNKTIKSYKEKCSKTFEMNILFRSPVRSHIASPTVLFLVGMHYACRGWVYFVIMIIYNSSILTHSLSPLSVSLYHHVCENFTNDLEFNHCKQKNRSNIQRKMKKIKNGRHNFTCILLWLRRIMLITNVIATNQLYNASFISNHFQRIKIHLD